MRHMIKCSQCKETFPSGYEYRTHWENTHLNNILNMLKNKQTFIENLSNDEFYYGDVRDTVISASSINSILEGTFGGPKEWKIAFEVGKLFHCLTLEPEKVKDFEVQDVPRRKKGDTYLKQTEVNMCNDMKKSHDSHPEARGIIYGPGVSYEVPGYTILDGVLFIGKCDIHNPYIDYLGDLKSTSYLYGFEESIGKWYQSQLYLYWKIFGMATAYVVTDKKSLETDVIYPEKYHYAKGKGKVFEAISIYKREYPDHYQRNLELQKSLLTIKTK